MMGRKNGERFNLTKALGPLGMVRFIQQCETGVGDYTEEDVGTLFIILLFVLSCLVYT